LEDRRNVGENICNSGDGTDQTGPILDVYDDDGGGNKMALNVKGFLAFTLSQSRTVYRNMASSSCHILRDLNIYVQVAEYRFSKLHVGFRSRRKIYKCQRRKIH